MKYDSRNILGLFLFAVLVSGSGVSFAAQTVCNDNGGVGWDIPVSSVTNITIPFQFGDVSTAYDINVFTDISKAWVGDLTARVTSPQGTTVWLFERPGTTLNENQTGPPWGCNGNDIVVTFDDEAAVGTNIENVCDASTPTIGGTYLPHNPAPNNLSAIDGEDPNGDWGFELVHSEPYDPGTLNNVCITAAYAAVTFDKWVSTSNTCSDTLDTLTVTSGTDVYYCYIVSNPGTETFTINPGDTTDDQGHDLSGLETTYVAGASQTVVVGPITAGSAALPDNLTTVNNAQVSATFATANYSGTLVTDETASLTVSVSPPAPPANGSKQLYLLNLDSTLDLTRTIPGANENTADLRVNDFQDYDQTPVFQAPFTITGDPAAVTIYLTLERRGGGGSRTVQVELFNGRTNALIGTDTFTWNSGGRVGNTFTIPVAADVNFASGDFVRLRVTNTSANGRRFRVHQRTANLSQVQMKASTVINVDNVAAYVGAYPATAQYASYIAGNTVYIRALVSDPFGSADITGATLTITDPATTVQVNAAPMTPVATPTGATKIYEYAYAIPAAGPDGYWSLSVTANEGAEGTISHTGQSTLIVGTPGITVSKTSLVLADPVNTSNPKAIPGAIVEYTVNVTNTGFGYVDADTLVISDPLATNASFFFGSPLNPATFIDGAVQSGLSYTFTSLSSTTDDIDFSNDGGATFITPTTDANGYDTTVPPINLIRINPKGGFRGSDGSNNPSMMMKFRVKIN